ncbi:MAG TPA: C40 family peptidase, partial [Actinomycetes bacterium]|nr:C40 family peptidase [Actinomycetes bacterium]
IAKERAERARRAEQARRAAAAARVAAAAAAARTAGGGSSTGGASAASTTASSGTSYGTVAGAAAAISYAREQIGKPYVWAAAGPDTFDCSGLTMRAWQAGGVSLPHYSVAQWDRVKTVDLDDLRAGDLVFFATSKTNPATIYHVGLYIGGGQMIEAPYTGENVRISSIYRASLFGAGRP